MHPALNKVQKTRNINNYLKKNNNFSSIINVATYVKQYHFSEEV